MGTTDNSFLVIFFKLIGIFCLLAFAVAAAEFFRQWIIEGRVEVGLIPVAIIFGGLSFAQWPFRKWKKEGAHGKI